MSASNDIKIGREALTYFHNEALKFPDNYNISFEELVGIVNDKSPSFLSTFGSAIVAGKVPDSVVQESMIKLADEGQGKLPVWLSDFYQVLMDSTMNVSFSSAVVSGLKETATQLSSVGEAGLTGLKYSFLSLPIILAGAVFLFVFLESKKV